ncbi:nitrate reductase molybdenum cofactor assembly chaperone [Nonomuraea typhae]|uniref:nitrate reductase molybdenum cofactor assembly chaperone n=1 Tax=Nonomuraea typhae TaxID=2603600 RepID=UPI0012FCCEEE|nr:nitrate reductase molybdenum cofactor assembly chaperone [Nonomuraea typhae]
MAYTLTRGARVLHQAAAHCLVHPDEEFRGRLPLLRDALTAAPHPAGARLWPFLAYAEGVPPAALAAHYVEVFDFRSRHSLYLSWWLDGDTRRRGASLVAIKEVYRAHGLEFRDGELPDFLPVVLEFTAATGAAGLLLEHRPGLELLRLALGENGSPYRHVVEAVCATLPGPSPRDRAEARALAAAGPRVEQVGLPPFPGRASHH